MVRRQASVPRNDNDDSLERQFLKTLSSDVIQENGHFALTGAALLEYDNDFPPHYTPPSMAGGNMGPPTVCLRCGAYGAWPSRRKNRCPNDPTWAIVTKALKRARKDYGLE